MVSHTLVFVLAASLLISSLGYRLGLRDDSRDASTSKVEVANAVLAGSFLYFATQLVWLLLR